MKPLAIFCAVALLLALLAPPRSHAAGVDVWSGTTDQHQRITFMVENGVVKYVNVRLHLQSGSCSSHYTSIHYGNLAWIDHSNFQLEVDNEREKLVVIGQIGTVSSGRVLFENRALPYVCPGVVDSTWRAEWTSSPPLLHNNTLPSTGLDPADMP